MSLNGMRRVWQVAGAAAMVSAGALAWAAGEGGVITLTQADDAAAVTETQPPPPTDPVVDPAATAPPERPDLNPQPPAVDRPPLRAPQVGPADYLPGSPSGDAQRVRAITPLMGLLNRDPDATGGFSLTGHVQGGYTYDPHHDSGDTIFGRVFDDEFGNAPQLDQVALSLQRAVARDRFDVGGRIEVIYGYDTFRFHSNGMNFYGGCCGEDETRPDSDVHDPRVQLDLTQAYLDVNLDVGTGLLVRLGKFVTPLGYETIDPTTTPFYSRSYLFGFAKPFTHAGVLLNYRLNDQWEAWGGVVRGWDQSLEDANDSVSLLGRLDWRPDPRWDVRVGAMAGRENAGCDGCGGSDESRTLVDVIVTHAVTGELSLGVEALYGRSGAADVNDGSAEWYGAAGYAAYAFSQRVTGNARIEWFRDRDGTRLLTGEDLEVTSATVGLSLVPFAADATLNGLRIQPEIRYDHATAPEFDGGTRSDQLTFGLSITYAF